MVDEVDLDSLAEDLVLLLDQVSGVDLAIENSVSALYSLLRYRLHRHNQLIRFIRHTSVVVRWDGPLPSWLR